MLVCRAILLCAISVSVLVARSNAQKNPEHDLPQAGPGCAKSDLTKTGRPVMFPARDGISIGFSVPLNTFRTGERIYLHVWIDNQTDKAKRFMTCSSFYQWDVDVYAANGGRILSRAEKAGDKEGQGRHCFRNFAFEVPPHTCQLAEIVDHPVVNQEYDLPPGQYFVIQKRQPTANSNDRDSGDTMNGSRPAPGKALVIWIKE